MYIRRKNGKTTVQGPTNLEIAIYLIVGPIALFNLFKGSNESKELNQLVKPYVSTFGIPTRECQTILEIDTIKCLVLPDYSFDEAVGRMESSYPNAALIDSKDDMDWRYRTYDFPAENITINIYRNSDESVGVHIELQAPAGPDKTNSRTD